MTEELLLKALRLAVDHGGGTAYDGPDDEIGTRCCCYVVSYKPHEKDCWVTIGEAAIASATGAHQ